MRGTPHKGVSLVFHFLLKIGVGYITTASFAVLQSIEPIRETHTGFKNWKPGINCSMEWANKREFLHWVINPLPISPCLLQQDLNSSLMKRLIWMFRTQRLTLPRPKP